MALRSVQTVILGAMLVGLAACASPYTVAKPGTINRPIDTVWIGGDKFIYVPGPAARNFTFRTAHNDRVIAPGLMYTDGGSIPRAIQAFKGFSPWGYGPAYIVHDWIFYARHCYVDARNDDLRRYDDVVRFRDVQSAVGYGDDDFNSSAIVLAEVVRSLIDTEQVQDSVVPATLISSAVDSVFARALWDKQGSCEGSRVRPEHIAIVWVRYNDASGPPPPTWKLSSWEIGEARRFVTQARCLVRTVGRKDGPRRCPGPALLRELAMGATTGN